MCKDPVKKCHHQQANTQFFYRLDARAVAQQTVTKHRMKTEQRITITVLGDVVPGRLVHVVLVVSGKNLFLHRFVTAVWTEWRISSQTEHTQRQCESYIYTAQSHTASLIDCLQPFDIPYRLCRKFQASTQNCTLHGGVLCPSIDNVNCVSTHICLQLLLIVVHCILFYFIVIY